jgi:hypothetical protein
MSKPKKDAEAPLELTRPRPPHGGRFIRDPKTGELECVERTNPASTPSEEAPAAEPESGPAEAESGGGATDAGSGSTAAAEPSATTTAGNGEQQEG